MKKLILIFIASCGILNMTVQAQDSTKMKRKDFKRDAELSRWVLDVNLLGGLYTQDFTTANSSGNYLNEIGAVSNMGTLKFKNGSSFGGDAQIGFFFGQKRHWGIGTGFMYLYQQGDATLDNFHVEYQATDRNGVVFRQLITGNQVKEHITSNNMNIPLVLKYKNRFSKHWGFTADAGALFNLQMKNNYNNNQSSFDYEAIYAYNTESGTPVAYYDNSPIPGPTDVLYTKAFMQQHDGANFQSTVATLQNEGYNIGFGVKPRTNTGSESYTSGSVGLLVQPSMNYFLSDAVALNFGLYYIYQPFKNNAQSGYNLTGRTGDYSTTLSNVTSSNAQTYGLNVGVRFFLGKTAPLPTITSIDSMAPSLCGSCDGAMTLHGLKAGKSVVVNYNYNGMPQAPYSTTVDANGSVRIPSLCAGNYSNITAKVGRHTIAGWPINIVAPALVITSENSTNPTDSGKCNGTITLNGMYAGKNVTVSYNFNGTPQPPYTGIVNADNTVTISGLCAGTYSGVVVSISTCTANGTDITLTDPLPPPPPPPAPVEVQRPDISTPILFNFNKSTVHQSSMPLIKEAAEEMKADPDAVITVNGYTDAIGSVGYNKKLSVRRAAAVKSHLKKFGISGNRVKTVGHGKSDPAATNATPEGRKENRRAIMDIEDKK